MDYQYILASIKHNYPQAEAEQLAALLSELSVKMPDVALSTFLYAYDSVKIQVGDNAEIALKHLEAIVIKSV